MMTKYPNGRTAQAQLKKIHSQKWTLLILTAAFLTGCGTTNSVSREPKGHPLLTFDRAPQSFQPKMTNEQIERQEADVHFTLAETYSFQGESSKAIEQFKQTLLLDPDSVTVRLRLSAEYVRAGLITEAIEVGESTVKMDPKNPDARMLLGGLYTGVKLYDQAIEQFDAAFVLDSSNEEAAIFKGALIAEKGELKAAEEFFKRLSFSSTFQAKDKIHYYLGKINHEKKGPVEKTVQELRKALNLNPAYREAAMTLAQIQFGNKDSKDAEKTLLSYQDKNGPDPDMARLLAREYLERKDFVLAYEQLDVLNSFEQGNPSIQIQMALISMELKENDRAISILEEILKDAPELDKARFYLGALYLDKDDHAKALEHLRVIPAASTYFIEARIQVSQIFRASKRIDRSEDVLRQSIKERPDAPQFVAALASILDVQKKYSEARSVLEKGVEEFPQDTQVRFFLGSVLDRLGKVDESMVQLRTVIEQDPDHVQALNYLAYTLAERGEALLEAKEMAMKALRLSPNDPFIMDTLGWIHFKNGNYREAQKLVEAAYRQKPDEAIIVEHLGDIYVKTEAWGMALAMYQQAQVLEADEEKAKKLMDKIASVQDQKQPSSRLPASLPSQ